MNPKQVRLLKEAKDQIEAIYAIADDTVNGGVFSSGLIDGDEIYLRTLIALSAIRSINDMEI